MSTAAAALASTPVGAVFAWGSNSYGQLGNGSPVLGGGNTTETSSVPGAVSLSSALAGRNITVVATGFEHSLAVDSSGGVFAWGGNVQGQLGNNATTLANLPVAVDTSGALAGKTIVSVAAGSDHSLALASDGKVFAWGYNAFGQLGNNSTLTTATPVAVEMSSLLAGKTIVRLAAHGNHSAAVASDGPVYAWGDNYYGQLGNNSTLPSATPAEVDRSGALAGKTIVRIAAGLTHTLALASDGLLYAWARTSGASWAPARITAAAVRCSWIRPAPCPGKPSWKSPRDMNQAGRWPPTARCAVGAAMMQGNSVTARMPRRECRSRCICWERWPGTACSHYRRPGRATCWPSPRPRTRLTRKERDSGRIARSSGW